VEPILTPLAADAAYPFPFISNLGLNLGVLVTEPGRRNRRFVRIKVPPNRPRWVPLPGHAGWVPLEQVIADNLSTLFPRALELACWFFRVTRGAKDDPWTDQVADEDVDLSPGAIESGLSGLWMTYGYGCRA
jgi:polyphosphate kinase